MQKHEEKEVGRYDTMVCLHNLGRFIMHSL